MLSNTVSDISAMPSAEYHKDYDGQALKYMSWL